MKAVILAAGRGSRMGQYGDSLPKGLLSFAGHVLLDWQVRAIRAAGIQEIAVVTGYRGDMIKIPGVERFHNEAYGTTNMVESLMCASPFFEGPMLVAYSDILYAPALVEKMIAAPADVGVAVDQDWRAYWEARYGVIDQDLESLTVSNDGRITDLGRLIESSVGIAYRYIGMVRFSSDGLKEVLAVYDRKKQQGDAWSQSEKPFRQGYMTDLLNEAIQNDVDVLPVISKGDWLEFDTAEDYERMSQLHSDGSICRFIDLDFS